MVDAIYLEYLTRTDWEAFKATYPAAYHTLSITALRNEHRYLNEIDAMAGDGWHKYRIKEIQTILEGADNGR